MGPSFRAERLLRVIVAPEGSYVGPWKLQSVELYDDGVVLRAWRGDPHPPDDPLADGIDDEDEASIGADGWEIEDDLGTRYEFHGGGSSMSAFRWSSEAEFTP